ncbi:MAG: hypothetical protein V1725_03035 [archaeon]
MMKTKSPTIQNAYFLSNRRTKSTVSNAYGRNTINVSREKLAVKKNTTTGNVPSNTIASRILGISTLHNVLPFIKIFS